MASDVRVTEEGLRHLNRLPDKVRAAVVETIMSAIAEAPRRAGKALRGDLEGLYSTRRGDFRVIYEVDDGANVVVIHRSPHRMASS